MSVKVRSINPIYLTISKGMAFVSREMIQFRVEKDKFVSVVLERAFLETVEQRQQYDQNGDPTTLDDVTVRTYVETIRQKNHKLPFEAVDTLFNAIGITIKPSDSFVEKFKTVREFGLLIDTGSSDVYNTTASDWIIDND